MEEEMVNRKLNQVIEAEAIFHKEERKGLRHDWFRAFELQGMRQALEFVLETGELVVLDKVKE